MPEIVEHELKAGEVAVVPAALSRFMIRARFAARTLIHWYRAGLAVERELPKLATYLGHVPVNETYWYLEAVPELLQLATDRVRKNRKEVRP